MCQEGALKVSGGCLVGCLGVFGGSLEAFRAECDIRENFDTIECPNIFVLISLTRTNVRISIRIENCTKI